MKPAILILLLVSALSAEYIVEWNSSGGYTRRDTVKTAQEAASIVNAISMDIEEKGGSWWIEVNSVKPVVQYVPDNVKIDSVQTKKNKRPDISRGHNKLR